MVWDGGISMTINIGDVSISIPVAIDRWAHESEDNMTEFNGMIESMMYAVNKVMKSKYSAGPYQKIYEKQIKELKELGVSEEDANKYIEKLMDYSDKNAKDSLENFSLETILKTLLS